MLCRMIIVIAAALAMAACDSSGPDEQPGPITTTDTSDTGKGDDPHQPDTHNTAPSDTFTPPKTIEDLCEDLLALRGIWWCESENIMIDGDRLDITIQASATGDQCEVTFACDGCGTWSMTGKIFPLTAEYKNGIYDWTTKIFIEGGALIREDVRKDRPDAPIRIEFYR
jgi:hypothetical protein